MFGFVWWHLSWVAGGSNIVRISCVPLSRTDMGLDPGMIKDRRRRWGIGLLVNCSTDTSFPLYIRPRMYELDGGKRTSIASVGDGV